MNMNEGREKKSVGKMNAGEEGVITKIRGAAAMHRYLFGLGIIAGTAITRIRSCAPAVIGNPMPFKVRNKVVYLTDEISRCIQVAVLGEAHGRNILEMSREYEPERDFYPLSPGRPLIDPVNF